MQNQMPESVKETLNTIIAEETDPDRIAQLEIVREFFTNKEFQEAMTEFIWQTLNNK